MRIIIKIGSSTLTHKTGKLNLRLIEKYIRVLSDLKTQGHEIILVSSGAMAVGAAKMNLPQKPEETPKKQAIAAVGQSELMSIYSRLFADYGCQVGQILLTKDVTSREERRNNVINTFNALLGYGCIPIVNENDSVEVEEIKFGDNDTLSAIVAECIAADLLILLTDIDALYDGDPRENPNAEKIHTVEEITDHIRRIAGAPGSNKGTGGMSTKVKAAAIATEQGIPMYIGSGENPEIIYDFLEGKPGIGTYFKAKKTAKEQA